jgi:hypothetical protein
MTRPNPKGARTRKRPERPYRRAEWLADITHYGRECTPARAWEAKNLAGLVDGLVDASVADKRERSYSPLLPDDPVEVPRWVVDGLLEYIKSTAKVFRIAPTGRHSTWVERYIQDAVDFARYDAVHGFHFNRGLVWPDAYEEAAKTLSGLAGGSIDTIEESYKRVAKALRNGQWGRYYRSTRFPVRHLNAT